jgi:hypothetical protein
LALLSKFGPLEPASLTFSSQSDCNRALGRQMNSARMFTSDNATFYMTCVSILSASETMADFLVIGIPSISKVIKGNGL